MPTCKHCGTHDFDNTYDDQTCPECASKIITRLAKRVKEIRKEG